MLTLNSYLVSCGVPFNLFWGWVSPSPSRHATSEVGFGSMINDRPKEIGQTLYWWKAGGEKADGWEDVDPGVN